jgi:hypothetical protein
MPSVEGVDDNVPPRGYGVRGRSNFSHGVFGYSGAGYGVAGQSDSNVGVVGWSRNGNAGVIGRSPDTGVFGWSDRGGSGVSGYSREGYGVHGVSVWGNGVVGSSKWNDGVSGFSMAQPGVRGVSVGGNGVVGSSEWNDGVSGFSMRQSGVRGVSVSHNGVVGSSDGNDGVSGSSIRRNGVTGYSSDAFGVYGSSYNGGCGVYGGSRNCGVHGFGDQVGVAGTGTEIGIFAHSFGGSYAAYLEGRVRVIGSIQKSGGSFKIDHPLDPANKYLSHSFVESPDMKNIYDGVTVLDNNGEAEIELPEWFGALNKDFRYQLTAIGAPGPNLYIAEEISAAVTDFSNNNNSNKKSRFKVAGGTPGMKVSWHVTGIRKDPWANAHRIPVEENKPDKERGYYIHPELYNQPAKNGMSHLFAPEIKKELLINENKRPK